MTAPYCPPAPSPRQVAPCAGPWRAAAARAVAGGLSIALTLALPAPAQAPLAVIDWLRETVAQPDAGSYPVTPPTGDAWMDGVITMRPLDAPRPESVGLFAAARVGLPRDFWGTTGDEELAVLIRALPADTLPALRALAFRVLLAEFDAPRQVLPAREATEAVPPAASAFLLARIDKLIEFGAIDQAAALLESLDARDGELRRRRFEIALLLGQESAACDAVLGAQAAFTFEPAVIFCEARAGDWPAAEARFRRARDSRALGEVYAPLLERFLDADDHLHEERLPLPDMIAPARMTPLAWRLLEAIGEPVATHGLPVAFAHADLRGTIGWRAQIEAAERLVRAGALAANQLLGLYTERAAAASGGIWERVRAVQQLDEALARGNPAEVGAALMAAWPAVVEGELEVAFATLFAEALRAVSLNAEAADLAFVVGLLSDGYETVAIERTAGDETERFLTAVARGLDPGRPDESAPALRAAVAEAFAEPPPVGEATLARLAGARLGEEVLLTLIRLGNGSDPRHLTQGLAVLRHVGLEDIARRAALQALLLERRG